MLFATDTEINSLPKATNRLWMLASKSAEMLRASCRTTKSSVNVVMIQVVSYYLGVANASGVAREGTGGDMPPPPVA